MSVGSALRFPAVTNIRRKLSPAPNIGLSLESLGMPGQLRATVRVTGLRTVVPPLQEEPTWSQPIQNLTMELAFRLQPPVELDRSLWKLQSCIRQPVSRAL